MDENKTPNEPGIAIYVSTKTTKKDINGFGCLGRESKPRGINGLPDFRECVILTRELGLWNMQLSRRESIWGVSPMNLGPCSKETSWLVRFGLSPPFPAENHQVWGPTQN